MQVFYTVRPGDTLFLIAKRWDIPLDSLIAANNLTAPYSIFPGQQLSVPPGVETVRVRSGDTVYSISRTYGISPSLIIEANRLLPPYIIQVGQLLKVPRGNPYYIVQPGDTLSAIAWRYNVMTGGRNRFDLIQQVNSLSSTTIIPGMRLAIPYAPPGGPGFIAYTNGTGETYDILLYNPRNGESPVLVKGLADRFSVPYWSSDAARIAFVGVDKIIYVTDTSNGSSQKIDQLEVESTVLDWEPNVPKLAYVKADQIVVYDVVSHKAQTISLAGASEVQWLPNGMELLAVTIDESGASQVLRLQVDGGGTPEIIKNTEGPVHNIRVSPDGSFMLFTTPGVSISIIMILNINTGSMVEVPGGPLAKNYYPEWSPDSKRIAYSATEYSDKGYYSLIRVYDITSKSDRTWSVSDCFATPVTWSPNGNRIAYLSGCNQGGIASEIWAFDLRHPAPIGLVSKGRITALSWSPINSFSN
ncbi:MAG: LysM peptidoglycan-binding domain-containing protein [Clostridia bacterium]|nr:LysM peptidoglycan-binding domain-containing protein [Clostridia bacterium]